MTDPRTPMAGPPDPEPRPPLEDKVEAVVPPGMRPGAWWRIGLIALLVVVVVLLVMQGGWWSVDRPAN